ncbi:MAG: glycosyltransferase family protein [Flavipsychrobacter sp.]
MKILFAIQGTGNGHLSRARDVYPELKKYGTVDVLVSGIQADVKLPYSIKYQLYGMSFIFGSKGGVDILKTAKSIKLFKLLRDIKSLPVEEYDLVVNDFEPVSAWACKRKNIPCVSLSHQCAVINENSPKPRKKDLKGTLVLKYYAPTTAAYGFHFEEYDDNIFTPVIRKEIRNTKPEEGKHYTVYLPAYSDEYIVKHLSHFDKVQWQVFSKHNKSPFEFKNITVTPIENETFIKSMASSKGVLCGAGFEGPAEALHLGKKVLAIPMLQQYEQQCNAAALEEIGVPVIEVLGKKYYPQIENWIANGNPVEVNYPDNIEKVIAKMIKEQVAPRKLVKAKSALSPA